MSRRRFLLGALALGLAPTAKGADEFLWTSLRRGGNVMLMRHASTEAGLGDPAGFRIDDCTTQRNLSPRGRDEATRVGQRLRQEKVPVGRVFTSPWCRCRDTAMLAFGHSEDWEPLSSFFDFPDREAGYVESIRKRISSYAGRSPAGNVVMVTHNVNIAALTKLSVGTGEIVAVRPDGCCGLRTLGRLLLT
jgi:phosphohistidine phosphatase SixA